MYTVALRIGNSVDRDADWIVARLRALIHSRRTDVLADEDLAVGRQRLDDHHGRWRHYANSNAPTGCQGDETGGGKTQTALRAVTMLLGSG